MSSSPPVSVNTCNDADDPSTDSVQIESFCTTDNGTGTVATYCRRYGGTTNSNIVPLDKTSQEFTDSEWGYSNIGGDSTCTYDDCNNGWLARGTLAGGGGCNGTCCAITGAVGFCGRIANFGDPLICALRDYQCNGSNQPSNSSCFSDNLLNSTCSKDFRAPDTQPSQFLLNQLCLGNIEGVFPPIDNGDIDFTSLWTNPLDPNGNPWTVNSLPTGSTYLTSLDINQNGGGCQLGPDGNVTGSNNGGKTCVTSTWALGEPGAPLVQLPTPNPFLFNKPPCQEIFWRTLYGNGPTFKNNFWKPNGSNLTCQDGSIACANTSVDPQQAACGSIPFQGTPTPIGFANAQTMITNAVNKFDANGGNLIGNLSTNIDQPFLKWLFTVCGTYPGLCSTFLKPICSQLTKETLQTNPQAAQWCGCYLNDDVYEEYSKNYGINKECTPYCNAADVIPLTDPDTGNIVRCNQSICMIDDVTINLAKTRLTGKTGVNFSQMCNSCSGSSGNGVNSNANSNSATEENTINANASINCQCIINGYTLTSIGATIEGGISIPQTCNGNSKCYSSSTTGVGGSVAEVDCHGSSTSNNDVVAKAAAAALKKTDDLSRYWILLIFIIVIALIILFWFLIWPRNLPENDTIYTKVTTLPPPPPVTVQPFVNNQFKYGKFEKSKAKFF